MDAVKLKKIIFPTPIEIILCLVAAVLIVLVFHFNEFLQFVSQSSAVTSSDITNTYQNQLEQLDQFEFLRTVVLVVFWATVGLAAYVVYLVISQALTNLRNEVVITTQFTNRGRFELILLPVVIHSMLAIAFLVGLWLSYYVGLPTWFSLVEKLLFEGYWIYGLLGFLGLSTNLYILWLQFQLVKSY